MTSPNLAIPHVAAAQAQKEVTINDGFDRLDRAVTDFLAVDLSAGNVTLTAAQYRGHRIFRSQNLTVARTLTVPAIRREVSVDNADGTAVLTVARGTGSVDVPAGAALIVYTDGTANGIRPIGGVGGGGGGGTFLDLSDTPASYAGQSLRPVRVNLGETGLEFFAPGLSAGNWAVPFRGALVRRTADATSLTFPWLAAWQTAVYDTDSFWSSTAPTRLTVPAGISRNRLHGAIRLPDVTGTGAINLQFLRNGARATAPSSSTLAICRPAHHTTTRVARQLFSSLLARAAEICARSRRPASPLACGDTKTQRARWANLDAAAYCIGGAVPLLRPRR